MSLANFKDALVQGARLPLVKTAIKEAGVVLMQVHSPVNKSNFKPIHYTLTPEKEYLHKRKNSTSFIYREDLGFLTRAQLITLCSRKELTYYHNVNDPSMDYWESLISY